MVAGALVAALLLSSATTEPSSPPSLAGASGQMLADKLDVAFRACALQLSQRGTYLVNGNTKELGKQGIALATPPAEVLGMATRLFADSGIYASVAAPSGKIWISTSATVSACKVTLADTELALTGRYNWSTRLRSSATWQYDKARSGQSGPLMREFFVLNADRPGPHMVMFIDGPNTVFNGGKGIQMIITVTIEPAKAQ
jgi:hypothetical protein